MAKKNGEDQAMLDNQRRVVTGFNQKGKSVVVIDGGPGNQLLMKNSIQYLNIHDFFSIKFLNINFYFIIWIKFIKY